MSDPILTPAHNNTAHTADVLDVAAVTVRGVNKQFQTASGTVHALENINLSVAAGEFVSLIGPSGCGKSTLMRLIADLDDPTSGELAVFGKTATQARLDQDYGIAFQQAGLLPWRTVAANVSLPLELHGVASAARSTRVAELLDMVGLTDFADRFPDQLSGGMQQRVAIARSLAEQPRLLLMDEPFGALDEMTREKMQTDLVRIAADTGAAVVFVTHSIRESTSFPAASMRTRTWSCPSVAPRQSTRSRRALALPRGVARPRSSTLRCRPLASASRILSQRGTAKHPATVPSTTAFTRSLVTLRLIR